MQTHHTIIKYISAGLCLALCLLAACKKDKVEDPTRLFRPVIKEDLHSEGNWIEASWQQVKGAKSYTLQVSRDTFKTVDLTLKVDTSAVLIENLKWNQLYQVQVKAIAADTTLNSKMSLLGNVKTPRFPTILNAATVNDVTDTSARASWMTSGNAVTSVKVLLASDSSVVKEVALTPTDVTNQYKVINGLKPKTAYIIYLYSGATVRGWDNYTTKESLTGNIIDLRSITDRPSVLTDTLPLIASGSTVLLKRGYVYTVATTSNLSKSVTIMSGDELGVAVPAGIYITSNFNIVANSNIEYIVFKNVFMWGNDYANRYVFNISNASTIGKIAFESCRMRIMRGVVRLQTAVINLTDFSVNNCIVDSISNYGVINVDHVNCKATNISITNSTFFKVEKLVTSKQNSNSVTIENCTFNEAPWGGNYLIDYSTAGTNNVTSGIKIANSIMGIGYSNAGVTAVRGIRVGTASIDVSNTYNTSDYTLTSNPIPNLTAYPKASTDLFQDPKNGNFGLKDASYAGRANTGDPRWRP